MNNPFLMCFIDKESYSYQLGNSRDVPIFSTKKPSRSGEVQMPRRCTAIWAGSKSFLGKNGKTVHIRESFRKLPGILSTCVFNKKRGFQQCVPLKPGITTLN